MKKTVKTRVVPGLFTEGTHQVEFSIDHQSFRLQEVEGEGDITSKERAEFYKRQLDIAFDRLLDNKTELISSLTFGQALEALKQGKKVARNGWNGKGMFLWLLPHNNIPKDWIKDPVLMEILGDRDSLPMTGCIRMKAADGTVVTGWLASQTDMLAEDWMILD